MPSTSSADQKLTARTIKIIERHGRILLKNEKRGWYVGQWTNIAAGPDNATWSKQKGALEMFSLKWAFAIAPLYDCKVVVVYPKTQKARPIVYEGHIDTGTGGDPRPIVYEGHIDAGTGGDPSYMRKADGSR